MRRRVSCICLPILCILLLCSCSGGGPQAELTLRSELPRSAIVSGFLKEPAEDSGEANYTKLSELLADCPVIVEVQTEERDHTWSKKIKSDRYTCRIVKDYSENTDARSKEQQSLYLYEPLIENAWTLNESYIFFLSANNNYTWGHFTYVPICSTGLWGEKTDDGKIQIFYDYWKEILIWEGSEGDFAAAVRRYTPAAPLQEQRFNSVSDAADHADDVLYVEVMEITDDNNIYTRNYQYKILEVCKKSEATGFAAGKTFTAIGPYMDTLKVGDKMVLMYETKNGQPGYAISYEHGHIHDEALIQEALHHFGKDQAL